VGVSLDSEMDPDAVALRQMAEEELGVPSRLRDYQWEGVAFLYRSRGALLADEMGLGKTVQAAVALALLLRRESGIRRVLIVAPSSLTTNWLREINAWAPSLTVRRVQGRASDREAYYLLPIPVLIASYEQIRRDGLDRIPADTFDLVVLDEAQRIKNRNSATALACLLLPRTRAWALSATPLENDEAELRTLLEFLESGGPVRRVHGGELQRDLDRLMLRRRKTVVRAELPPVLIQDLPMDLLGEQRAEYEEIWTTRTGLVRQHREDGEDTAALLGLLTRLKLACNFDSTMSLSSKLDALRVLCDAAGPSARILVFSQFVKTLEAISVRLDLATGLVTGSMPIAEREAAMDRFRRGKAPRVLLVSLRAGGVGLNLGEASHVVLFDRWWNPAVEMQAIFRAHRFEREEPLHVIRFLVQDSIEERIAAILEQKARLFEEVVESSGMAGKAFTKPELMSILGLSAGDLTPALDESGEQAWRR